VKDVAAVTATAETDEDRAAIGTRCTKILFELIEARIRGWCERSAHAAHSVLVEVDAWERLGENTTTAALERRTPRERTFVQGHDALSELWWNRRFLEV
jgi:hypothetical protein